MSQCRNVALYSKPVPHAPANAVAVWMLLSCIKKILNRLSLLTGPFNRYSRLCLRVICIVNVHTILFYIETETDCFI